MLIWKNEEIKALREYGENHVIDYDEVMKIYKGEEKCAGNRNGYTLYLYDGFKLVFSIEWTPMSNMINKVKLKRMSLSSSKKDDDGSIRYPNELALESISQLLGFSSLDKCFVKMNKNDPIPNIEIMEILEKEAV